MLSYQQQQKINIEEDLHINIDAVNIVIVVLIGISFFIQIWHYL